MTISYYEKVGNKVEKIDDEIPFDLPNGWTWCRFSEVIELFSGQDLTPDKYSDIPQGIPYITGASNLENGCVIVNRWTSSATTHATIGDLLLTVKGSGIGKMAIEKFKVGFHVRPPNFCDASDNLVLSEVNG